jgi:deazaflavin-dependent oxidoreductase (nitroreductase family)
MPSRIGNFFIKTLITSPLHPLLGESFALITVTGRRTGNPITTPINTVCIEDVLTVISMRSRTWWRNLRAQGVAQLRQAGRTFPVRAEVIEAPADVCFWLKKYFNIYPGYMKYFEIIPDPEGKPSQHELEQVAGERVIIRLFPI